MVEGRHAPCERERRLIGKRDGNAEAEMLRRCRHSRNQEERIVDRRLCRVAQSRFGSAAEDVVNSQHVGQEKPIEQPPLQRTGKLEPSAEPTIIARAVARMAPQAWRLVCDAVHLEGVQTNLLCHGRR